MRQDQPSQRCKFLPDDLEAQTSRFLDLGCVGRALAHHRRKDLSLHVSERGGRLLGHREPTVLGSSPIAYSPSVSCCPLLEVGFILRR